MTSPRLWACIPRDLARSCEGSSLSRPSWLDGSARPSTMSRLASSNKERLSSETVVEGRPELALRDEDREAVAEALADLLVAALELQDEGLAHDVRHHDLHHDVCDETAVSAPSGSSVHASRTGND